MAGSVSAAASSSGRTAKGKGKGKQASNDGNDGEDGSYRASASDLSKYSQGRVTAAPLKRNRKLATHMATLTSQQKRSAASAYEHDSLLLPQDSSARLQVETDLERTWKVSQADIVEDVGSSAGRKHFELALEDYGPYELDYTSDGRHLAIAGRKGHVATFDWQTGKLGTEIHLKETVRDIAWLHNTSFFAVAQKKYVYIYDSNGLEIHQLKNHMEVNRMEFLRYHFLLATVGNAGYLKYQDTSTGSIVAEHRSKLGSCSTMAQNPHSAVISLGHANGTVTMWTPNISTAQVKLLAHTGPISDIAYDPTSLGTYFATAGLDGKMKVWDSRKWGVVNEWQLRKPAASLAYSQKGVLACGWGNHATMYADTTKQATRAPGPYMTQLFPSTSVHALAFCPFEDVLGVGHARGFSSLIVPGAGEANYDSLEADPFESKKSRREREVVSLLDKIQPDQIHLDPELIGRMVEKRAVKDPLEGMGVDARRLAGFSAGKKPKSFAEMSRMDRLVQTGKMAEEDVAAAAAAEEEAEEEDGNGNGQPAIAGDEIRPKKPRGRNKVLKKILRRKKNVVDARTMHVKEMIEERRKTALDAKRHALAKSHQPQEGGALDRFS